tara:strand:+ start:2380 stop:2622 length:243 start_codon:yes stop_codon:yes gene_type:complete
MRTTIFDRKELKGALKRLNAIAGSNAVTYAAESHYCDANRSDGGRQYACDHNCHDHGDGYTPSARRGLRFLRFWGSFTSV